MENKTIEDKDLNIESVLVFSTAHLRKWEADFLEEWASYRHSNGYGFLVAIISDVEDVEGWNKLEEVRAHEWWKLLYSDKGELPPESPGFLPMFRMAREKGCSFILFDGAGDIVDGLPVYEWK